VFVVPKMVAFPTTLLLAAAISAWILCITAAFSTISFVGRAVSSSYHTSLLFQTKMDNKDSASDDILTNTTSSKDKAAIIFLHGLGDSPDGWSSLTEALPNMRPSLSNLDITYVFPPANTIAITVNGGEKMPGWFDVYDWPIGVDAKDDPKGLAMSVKRVEKV